MAKDIGNYTLKVDGQTFNLHFSMYFWRQLYKNSGVGLESIGEEMSSTDTMRQFEFIAHVILAGVETYNWKYKKDQHLDFDQAFELLEFVNEEQVTGLTSALLETQVLGKQLNAHSKKVNEGK